MAVLKDEEEQKGQGTSQALVGGVQPQEPQEEPAQPQMGGSTAPATIGGGGTTSPSVKAMPKQQKAGTGTFANLKSYLQAAQGGGRVSQAATQRVQNVAGQAQKGIQKAQETFGAQIGAGSGALFQGTAPGQFLTEEQATQAAQKKAAEVLKTAKGVTYQALQQPTPAATPQAEEVVSAQPQPQVPAQAQQYFRPEDLETYSNIINAQYQGPQSLQQAGLYEQAARKAQVAQQALQQTQTAAGREQLLRDVFGRNREYTRGQSKLDALLLNASQPAVQSLQQQAQQAGNIQQQLQEAQNVSANEAARRAAAIQGIASGARTAFTEARTAEETAVENRIKNLTETPVTDTEGKVLTKADGTTMTQWDQLPEYFRNVLRSSSKGQVKLSPEEMAVLGVSSGEGLYNLGENLIGNVQAEKERLITKDELSRQLALAQLAGLDTSKQLQKDLLYTDLEKAGTQDLLSSLDTNKIREALSGAQAGFRTAAEQADITGTGKKKVSRGNLAGKKTSTYYADVTGNVADMLRQGGYDVSAMSPEQTKSLLSDKDLLNRYLGATSTSRDTEANIGGSALEGAGTGAALGTAVAPGVGTAIGAAIGTAVGANTLDPIQGTTDIYKELEDKLGIKGLGAVGQGVQDVRSGVGGVISDVGNVFGTSVLGDIFRGYGGIVGGINTGEMKAYGSAIAKDLAIQDLQNKYADWLKGQGFENRLVASQDPEVLARVAGLQTLLRRQG